MKRYSTRRRRSPLEAPVSQDAASALAYGPADERQDATRVLMPNAAELMKLQQYQNLYAMAKADVPKPQPGTAMAYVDIGDAGGQRIQFNRPVGLSFEQLREVVRRGMIFNLIINTRIRQVQAFCNVPDGEADPGFTMRFKDRRRRVTDEDAERFHWMTQYVLNCGAEFDPRQRKKMNRDDLDDFVAKHLRDSLTLDHAPIELVSTLAGRVHGWVAVDGAHVYLTDPNAGLLDEYDGEALYNELLGLPKVETPQDIIAVYEKDGAALGHYTHETALIPIRNVTSDERYYGYGMPEPEEVIRVATAFLNAFTLNERGISDNSLPRGILGIMGETDEDDIDSLTYRLQSETKGASNRFRTTVMRVKEGGGVNWIPTGTEVNEQMYARWMTLQVAIACTAYSMNPEEIAFDSFTPGASTLSGSDTEAKLTAGTDKGLTTLLKWFRKTINELVAMQDPDVELAWNGLGTSKEEALAREDSLMTWGEKRRQYGLPTDDIPKELLNVPLNPVLSGVYQQVGLPQQEPEMPPGMDEGEMPPGMEGAPQGGEDDDYDQEHGPGGERRYQDHEGALWQQNVQPPQEQEGQEGQGPPQPPRRGQQLAKAEQGRYAPNLEVWPNG